MATYYWGEKTDRGTSAGCLDWAVDSDCVTAHAWPWEEEQKVPNSQYGNSRRQQLRKQIEKLKDIERRWPALRCYIGEFAWNRNAPQAGDYMRDVMAICRELNIHATVHAFNEASEWDYNDPGYERIWSRITNWLKPN